MSRDTNVTLVLFTYNRMMYAERTLTSALGFLSWPANTSLAVHIADDGSPEPDYINRLERLAGGYPHVKAVSSSNSQRGGYGASYNAAMRHVHQSADIVLALEDDWQCTRAFKMGPLIDALWESEDLGCIRLGYLGYTGELRGKFVYVSGYHYLVLDPTSAEPHVFAGHPRLEAVAWEREVGPWPEGENAGTTEFLVAHRAAARRRVAWPVDLVYPRGDLFAHIGTIPAREDQREAAV